MSGIKMIHGPDATVDSVGICSFEDNTSLLEQVTEPVYTRSVRRWEQYPDTYDVFAAP